MSRRPRADNNRVLEEYSWELCASKDMWKAVGATGVGNGGGCRKEIENVNKIGSLMCVPWLPAGTQALVTFNNFTRQE